MKARISYSVTTTVAYVVEVPNGMSAGEVAYDLRENDSFCSEHLYPDLSNGDWEYNELDWESCSDRPDFTADEVAAYLGYEEEDE